MAQFIYAFCDATVRLVQFRNIRLAEAYHVLMAWFYLVMVAVGAGFLALSLIGYW